MNDLIIQFQNSIITMFLGGRLSEEEFSILAILSEDIKSDSQELVLKLKPKDLKDRDVVDCIIHRHFKTALEMIR